MGEVFDKGPWAARRSDGKGVFVESGDFTHDVRLYVNGDFRDDEQRFAYAEGLAQALTTAQAEIEALRARVAELEVDGQRIDWLQSEMNDVRWVGGTGNEVCSPSDEVCVRIISHWQTEPKERVEGENWFEDLRAAIDEARAALSGSQT